MQQLVLAPGVLTFASEADPPEFKDGQAATREAETRARVPSAVRRGVRARSTRGELSDVSDVHVLGEFQKCG